MVPVLLNLEALCRAGLAGGGGARGGHKLGVPAVEVRLGEVEPGPAIPDRVEVVVEVEGAPRRRRLTVAAGKGRA